MLWLSEERKELKIKRGSGRVINVPGPPQIGGIEAR